MRRNVTTNLTNQLVEAQRELSSSTQTLNNLQTQLYSTQNAAQQAENQLNSALSTQAYLINQLEIQNQTFNALSYLLDQYRESEGITLNPSMVFTRTISAEELAHTDIVKEACKSNYQQGFDIALNKLTNLNFQDSDGKTILMHAIINGFYYGVDKLLQKGVNVNLTDNQGNNALIYCSQIPHIKYFKQIAEKTDNVNFTSSSLGSSNALHIFLSNVHKFVFASELNGELVDHASQYSKLIIDENHKLSPHIIGNVDIKGPFTLEITGEVNPKHITNRHAAYEKAVRLTKFLVEQKNINVNAQDIEGSTPLFLAAKSVLVDVIDLLVNNYGALDIANKYGYKAWDVATENLQQNLIDVLLPKKGFNPEAVKLWCAAKKGELNVVQQQINKGVDVNFSIEDANNTTPLSQSIISGHLPIVSALIRAGANINTLPNNNSTPLMIATINNKFEIVQLLLQHNANANISDSGGTYPLHFAVFKEFLNIIKLLIPHCNINQTNNSEHKVTALWLAAQDGRLDIVKLLADHGANINIVRADNGISPLCVSMQKQHFEVAKELLARGADVNIKDNQGFIALNYAISLCSELNINKAILEKTNNINIKDYTGATPLYSATCANNIVNVKLLMEKNADINISNNIGIYAWHYASLKGFKEIMQLLKPKIPNIDYKTTDSEQYTALWLASQGGHSEIVKWLIDLGADVNAVRQSDGTTVLQIAIVNNHLPVVNLLVTQYGADINQVNKDNATPLYYSLGYCHQPYRLEITEFLLKHNANIHVKTIFGDQAIHRASNLADIEAVKLLLQYGASVNEVNNDGYTPLHFLFDSQNTAESSKKLITAEYLLQNLASINIRNNDGKTAFDLARENFSEILPNQAFLEALANTFEHDVNITGATL